MRSHAMAYHRNRLGREARLPQEWSEASATRKGPVVSVFVPVRPIPREGRGHANKPVNLGENLEQQRRGSETALRTSWGVERTPQTHRRPPTTCTLPTGPIRDKSDLADDGYARSWEEHILRYIMARMPTLFHIGDGVDPFLVLPSFKSPEINSLGLKRHCKYLYLY